MNLKEIIHILKEDLQPPLKMGFLKFTARLFINTSWQVLIIYRLRVFCRTRGTVIRLLGICLEYLIKIIYGVYIDGYAEIGKGLTLAHPTGVVIGRAKIGNNVTIWQNVTIGSHGKVGLPPQYPTIGNNVKIFAGAVVMGEILIGDNVTIAANAVVNKSFPQDVVIGGIPAKVISSNKIILEN